MGVFFNLLWILSAVVGCCLLGVCFGKNVTASFVFGDSLVDSGNNNYLVSLSKANYEPNGIDFLPSRKPTGRYTNGRTMADILGQELGLKSFSPPFLAPTTVGDVVLNGVNYASGGGGILNITGEIFVGRINLDAQIDSYADTRQDIVSSIGMPAALCLLRNALFLITVGSNDFINNYLNPLLPAPVRALLEPPETFVEDMISKFRLQLTRLYYLDARKIVVSNIGPIGCIPYTREVNPLAGTNCVDLPNQLAESFNKRLKDLITELNSNLEGVFFVYANVYDIVSDILQHYSIYGFEVTDSACCFVAGRFGGLIPCSPPSKVCPDRSKYFFWDPYHPSDLANVLISKRVLDGDLNDAYPMNVRQLAQA